MYKFSEDLALEYAPLGIKIQCVLPGFVVSKMSRYKKPAFRIPLPRDFVRGHMRSLGLEFASAGFWVHKILVFIYFFLIFVHFFFLVLEVVVTHFFLSPGVVC